MAHTTNQAVSIPNRDFGELQSAHCVIFIPVKPRVSIPNRDFGELQFAMHLSDIDEGKKFQSLIGILVNCNNLFISL